MNKRILSLVLLFLCLSSISLAKSIGIGGYVGNQTGININFPQSSRKYYGINLAYDFSKDSKIALSGDYIFKDNNILDSVPVIYGGSIKIITGEDFILSVLGKGGIIYPIEKVVGLEIFGNIAPGIQLIPSTELVVDLELGIRYYFQIKN